MSDNKINFIKKREQESTIPEYYLNSLFETCAAFEEEFDKADKNDLSSHTSNNDIHITADERSKWNTASQKTDRLSFPTTYTNFYDNQYYVNSYGFEYVKLIEDAWIQNIEVSVVLPELRDSLTEINLASDSTITPNIIGEKVCKILVVEGLRDDHYVSAGNFIQDEDEIELGTSEFLNSSILVSWAIHSASKLVH